MLISIYAISGMALWDNLLPDISNLKFYTILILITAAHCLSFYVPKWYARLPLFIHMLIKAPIFMIVGFVGALIKNDKLRRSLPYISGSIPIMMIIFTFISYASGYMPSDNLPKATFVPWQLAYSVYWFSVTKYVCVVTMNSREASG